MLRYILCSFLIALLFFCNVSRTEALLTAGRTGSQLLRLGWVQERRRWEILLLLFRMM